MADDDACRYKGMSKNQSWICALVFCQRERNKCSFVCRVFVFFLTESLLVLPEVWRMSCFSPFSWGLLVFLLLLFSLFLWVFGVTCSLSRGWTWPSQACFVQEAPRRKRLLHCCPNVWVVSAVRREFYSQVPQLNESFSRQRDVLWLLLFAGGGAAGSEGLK